LSSAKIGIVAYQLVCGLTRAAGKHEDRIGTGIARDSRHDGERHLDLRPGRRVRVFRHRHGAAADFALNSRQPARLEAVCAWCGWPACAQ
jgi:hypothetical protein